MLNMGITISWDIVLDWTRRRNQVQYQHFLSHLHDWRCNLTSCLKLLLHGFHSVMNYTLRLGAKINLSSQELLSLVFCKSNEKCNIILPFPKWKTQILSKSIDFSPKYLANRAKVIFKPMCVPNILPLITVISWRYSHGPCVLQTILDSVLI